VPARSLRLASDALTISVAASVAECAWLAEFFGEGFAALADQPARVHVSLKPGFEWPLSDLPTGTRLAFALDAQPVRLPVESHDARQRLFEA
jgi:hypothetical protein